MNKFFVLATFLLLTFIFADESTSHAQTAAGDDRHSENLYHVENRWGGIWHAGGDWVLGGRDETRITSINIASTDNGASLNGSITYGREAPIGFRAIAAGENRYTVENQLGEEWHAGGTWTIGNRQGKNVIKLNISSPDSGMTLIGDMTYQTEGSISFRASKNVGVYDMSGNRIFYLDGELLFDDSGHEYYYDNKWERTSKDGGVMMVYHFNKRQWEWIEGRPMKKSLLMMDRVDKETIRRIYKYENGILTTTEHGNYPILTLKGRTFVNEFGEPVYSLSGGFIESAGHFYEWCNIILLHHYYEQIYESDAIVEINARRAVAADLFAKSNSLAVDVVDWGANYVARRNKKMLYFTSIGEEIFVLSEEQIRRIKNAWLVLNEKPLLGFGSPVVIPEASFYLSKRKAKKRGVQGVESDSVVLEIKTRPEYAEEVRAHVFAPPATDIQQNAIEIPDHDETARAGSEPIDASAPPRSVLAEPIHSGLQVRLRASTGISVGDGAAVSVWADESGNGRNAVYDPHNAFGEQAPVYDASNPGVNGEATVRFDNKNALDLDLGFLADSDYTIFVVNGRDRGGLANFYMAGDTQSVNSNLILGYERPNFLRQAHFGNDLDAAVEFYDGTEVYSLDAFRFSQVGGRDIFHNGHIVSSSKNTVPLRSNTNSALGHFRVSNNFWFQGDLAEVVVYDRALSDAEMLAVGNDLATRYGFPVMQ